MGENLTSHHSTDDVRQQLSTSQKRTWFLIVFSCFSKLLDLETVDIWHDERPTSSEGTCVGCVEGFYFTAEA